MLQTDYFMSERKDIMKLNQPYYIEPRKSKEHIDLNGEWSFCWSDEEITDFSPTLWKYETVLPKSIYHSLHEAGILPDPYFGSNSKEYRWVDEKIWYYRKKFNISKVSQTKKAFLCFDGVAYYCRIWLNGMLLGENEGMFGGPVCDVSDILIFSGENELIVEVKAFNFGCKENYDSQNNTREKNTPIVPWNIAKDSATSNGDFTVIGIWNHVRLELLEPLHISRPYLYTESASQELAVLHLEMEIADGSLNELRQYYGYPGAYTRAYDYGLTGATRDKSVRIVTEISESDTGKIVYASKDNEPLLDYDRLRMNPAYRELQYFTKTIEIKNPRLWYPHGMGESFLYDVKISLYDGEKLCDVQKLKTGIRTFTAAPTHGRKYRHRWQNFLFSINGKETFIKGINWMPIDFLYDINPDEYEWCLTLAKNAGIQLLRVWNGGGMFETDTFYQLCDKLGIMVWQDLLVANTDHSSSFSQNLLESQIAYNLYRIRNNPSLVLLCGGNEFNPYHYDNAAAMFVELRVCQDLAPHVIYHFTTPDKGSAHMYEDIEPVWFRHLYKELPFLAESGIHSFPSFATWKKLLSQKELKTPLPDLTSKEFKNDFPDLLNHFTEYNPGRVPRMLARASQIVNLEGVSLYELCEASQVQAYEYYTLMLQSMRENFPYCGGVMPWVFKRHWTTVGIQVVDGTGQPGYPYYAIQNGYKPTQIIWDVPWTVIAPGETLPLDITVLNEQTSSLIGSEIRITIYRPNLTVGREFGAVIKDDKKTYSFGEFTPDETYTDKCFLVSARLMRNGDCSAETTYFIKCTSALANSELYEKYRSAPSGNLYFDNGPWLKESISTALKTDLRYELVGADDVGKYKCYDINIENRSEVPAFPVTIHFKKDEFRHFESENFFLLSPKESRVIRITTEYKEKLSVSDIEVCAWNVGGEPNDFNRLF